jgi:hypothetical protein
MPTQPLNPLDLAIRCADRSIRGMGYPGFETQMLVWLSDRLETARLEQALARLTQRRPVLSGRLVEDDVRHHGRPYWKLDGAPAHVEITELTTADAMSVFDSAAVLLSQCRDLAFRPPVRFHLLRRPNGKDVFLTQYSHVLMDKSATIQLLREIDELTVDLRDGDELPDHEPRNVLHHWLQRLSPAERRAASRAAIELQGRTLRGRAAILGTGEEDKPRQVALRIATRTLDDSVVRAIHRRSAELCGLPNPSMVILAAAFRAIRQFGPAERNEGRNYIAGIGLDMKLRREDRALLQNLLSVVPLFAAPDQLADRDQLIRALSGQMRERLRKKIDWGVLRLVNSFHRKPRHIQWVVEHLLRWTYSLWYAYFGALDGVGERFCGVPIERVQYVGPTWSPVGISLLANQFRGQLLFQTTYDPDLIQSGLANQFLDAVLKDVRHFAGDLPEVAGANQACA